MTEIKHSPETEYTFSLRAGPMFTINIELKDNFYIKGENVIIENLYFNYI